MNSAAPAKQDIEQIVRDFESGAIDAGGFGHEAHILVGWWYLQEHDLLAAITRFTDTIRRLTRKLGVEAKYHETITWFYLIKIAERLNDADAADWPAFKAANADLFTWKPGLLETCYSAELLASAAAKSRFVLPDLLR